MQHDILLTSDGSQTLVSSNFNENYHSIHGALSESMHVFIENGLKSISELNTISILEMGMGTGLNVLLTIRESLKSDKEIYFTTYEKYPLPIDVYSKLNYFGENEKLLLEAIHSSDWNVSTAISKNFILEKRDSDIDTLSELLKYDLVYYDAFAPNTQPELWTVEIFDKIYKSMKEGGILVTYCAKGYVKRNLKEAGFEVQSLSGPPRKREMVKAIKQA